MYTMYRVLYRKYRPRLFSEICGQEHITSTLKNEIKNDRIAHAYLFTGSRGTGKTSSARILARAVNCLNNHDGEPCNECEICKGLENGTIYDIVEIDAASNNGVDSIRELREEANYTPSRAKYRVYIIDEVHMLSQGAFNALLKTLEEPPEHVIFILATTEVHKLPATILSRCQRFDFKRVGSEDMTVRLKEVSALEGFNITDDAATLIARISDGAVRNALSILDQCAGKDTTITSELVTEITGLANNTALYEITNYILNSDSSAVIDKIGALYQNSYDMEQLCNEMINHFRNLMVVKTVKRCRDLIICTDDEFKQITDIASYFTLNKIIFALDLLQNSLANIKLGANARIEMEMCLMKLCSPQLDTSVESLNDRIATLERKLKNINNQLQYNNAPVSNETRKNYSSNGSVDSNQREASYSNSHSETSDINEEHGNSSDNGADINNSIQKDIEFSQWADFIEMIQKKDRALYRFLINAKGYIREDYFLFDSPNPALGDILKKEQYTKIVKQILFEITGKQYKLGLYSKKNENKESNNDPLDNFISKVSGNQNIEIK